PLYDGPGRLPDGHREHGRGAVGDHPALRDADRQRRYRPARSPALEPVPTIADCAIRRSRPPFRRITTTIPTDRDHLFRSIATNAARVLAAPLDDGGDVSLLPDGQARREASR